MKIVSGVRDKAQFVKRINGAIRGVGLKPFKLLAGTSPPGNTSVKTFYTPVTFSHSGNTGGIAKKIGNEHISWL
jgi:hypothetical protein